MVAAIDDEDALPAAIGTSLLMLAVDDAWALELPESSTPRTTLAVAVTWDVAEPKKSRLEKSVALAVPLAEVPVTGSPLRRWVPASALASWDFERSRSAAVEPDAEKAMRCSAAVPVSSPERSTSRSPATAVGTLPTPDLVLSVMSLVMLPDAVALTLARPSKGAPA
jgi:hypothetical protein